MYSSAIYNMVVSALAQLKGGNSCSRTVILMKEEDVVEFSKLPSTHYLHYHSQVCSGSDGMLKQFFYFGSIFPAVILNGSYLHTRGHVRIEKAGAEGFGELQFFFSEFAQQDVAGQQDHDPSGG